MSERTTGLRLPGGRPVPAAAPTVSGPFLEADARASWLLSRRGPRPHHPFVLLGPAALLDHAGYRAARAAALAAFEALQRTSLSDAPTISALLADPALRAVIVTGLEEPAWQQACLDYQTANPAWDAFLGRLAVWCEEARFSLSHQGRAREELARMGLSDALLPGLVESLRPGLPWEAPAVEEPLEAGLLRLSAQRFDLGDLRPGSRHRRELELRSLAQSRALWVRLERRSPHLRLRLDGGDPEAGFRLGPGQRRTIYLELLAPTGEARLHEEVDLVVHMEDIANPVILAYAVGLRKTAVIEAALIGGGLGAFTFATLRVLAALLLQRPVGARAASLHDEGVIGLLIAMIGLFALWLTRAVRAALDWDRGAR